MSLVCLVYKGAGNKQFDQHPTRARWAGEEEAEEESRLKICSENVNDVEYKAIN